MNERCLDLPISTASARAASAIVNLAEELVSHGNGCQSSLSRLRRILNARLRKPMPLPCS